MKRRLQKVYLSGQKSPSKKFTVGLVYYLCLALLSIAGIAYGLFFSDLFFADDQPAWLNTLLLVLKLSWLVPLPYVQYL